MDQYSQRAILWMKALKYFREEGKWDSHSQTMKKQYQQYVHDFTSLELQILQELKESSEEQRKEIVEKYMNYDLYIKYETIHQCIEKDVMRTWHQQFNQLIDDKIDHLFCVNYQLPSKQYDIMRRILYIYGRLNPAIGYVSGMSYVLAPLLFVIQNEADCFFCFTIIMGHFFDVFLRPFDNNGVQGLILRFENEFKKHDLVLYDYLEKIGITSNMYCLQWFIPCFSMNSPERTLVIWDEMLQAKDYRQFQIDLAIQIIISIKNELLNANFERAIQLLSTLK